MIRLAVFLLLLPAAAFAGVPTVTAVTAGQPWMRYLLPDIPAAGYMVLQNTGDTDAVLTGASSLACGSLMLHQSRNDSGMAMMTDVPSLTIPAHGHIALSPGGYHLMCMTPRMKPGDKIQMQLGFQDGTALRLTMPVYGAQGAP